DRLAIAGEYGLERFAGLQFGPRLDEVGNMLEAEDDLRVHGMLDPERSILVEFGDALLKGHELLARWIRGDAQEVEDRLLGRPVVPRGERRPGLCLSRAGLEKPGQGWQGRQRAEDEATVQAIGMRGSHDDSPFGSCLHSKKARLKPRARPFTTCFDPARMRIARILASRGFPRRSDGEARAKEQCCWIQQSAMQNPANAKIYGRGSSSWRRALRGLLRPSTDSARHTGRGSKAQNGGCFHATDWRPNHCWI